MATRLPTDPRGVERAAAITNGMERVVGAGTVLLAKVTNLIPPTAAKASSSDRGAAQRAERLAEAEAELERQELNVLGASPALTWPVEAS